MADSSNNKLIISLAVLLAIVVAIGAIVIFVLPGSDTAQPLDPVSVGGGVDDFDLDVLRRQDHQTLNRSLVEDGSLPVQPPTGIGKANPFL